MAFWWRSTYDTMTRGFLTRCSFCIRLVIIALDVSVAASSADIFRMAEENFRRSALSNGKSKTRIRSPDGQRVIRSRYILRISDLERFLRLALLTMMTSPDFRRIGLTGFDSEATSKASVPLGSSNIWASLAGASSAGLGTSMFVPVIGVGVFLFVSVVISGTVESALGRDVSPKDSCGLGFLVLVFRGAGFG